MSAPYLIGLLLLLQTAGSAACCTAPTAGALQGGTVIVEKLPADPAQDQPDAAAKPADSALSGGSVVVETLPPEAAADAPVATERPAGKSAAPAATDVKPAGKPAATAPAKAAAAPPPAPQAQKPGSAAPPKPQQLPPLALAVLEQRLKDTEAIGLFTKIALKNQIDDLLGQIKAHHKGDGKTPLAQLRKGYDQLLLKLHGLLKDGDPSLGNAIMNSRDAIWAVLTDPVKFAKL